MYCTFWLLRPRLTNTPKQITPCSWTCDFISSTASCRVAKNKYISICFVKQSEKIVQLLVTGKKDELITKYTHKMGKPIAYYPAFTEPYSNSVLWFAAWQNRAGEQSTKEDPYSLGCVHTIDTALSYTMDKVSESVNWLEPLKMRENK